MTTFTTLSPLQCYQADIDRGQRQPDPDQLRVVQKLDALYHMLCAPQSWLGKLGLKRPASPKGFYLWGSVGTGKTFLMDHFFHCLPFEQKLRMHFHAFMQVVHTELNEHKGQQDPLRYVAKEFADKARVLCLDELIVNDITDAMLLAGLFEDLYQFGVCILFTSNIPPDRLYEKGLQRPRFLPAIDLIKQHSDIVELNTHMDYRQQYREHSSHYLVGEPDEITPQLQTRFDQYRQNDEIQNQAINIYGRNISVIKRTEHILWCDFLALCDIPRSQKDYLALANQYQIIMMSRLRPIKANENNLIRSFIHLIDVLYDQNTLLIIGAEAPIQHIYTEGRFLFAFARTQSRITEMQAQNWQEK